MLFRSLAPGERRPRCGALADRHVCHHAVPCICGAGDRILYDQTIDKRGGTAVKIIEGQQADCLRSRFIDAFIRKHSTRYVNGVSCFLEKR